MALSTGRISAAPIVVKQRRALTRPAGTLPMKSPVPTSPGSILATMIVQRVSTKLLRGTRPAVLCAGLVRGMSTGMKSKEVRRLPLFGQSKPPRKRLFVQRKLLRLLLRNGNEPSLSGLQRRPLRNPRKAGRSSHTAAQKRWAGFWVNCTVTFWIYLFPFNSKLTPHGD